MIDQNRLYSYIIITLIVFTIIIILSIYFGGQKGKFDSLNGFDSWRKRIDNKVYRIDKNTIKIEKQSTIEFNYSFIKHAKEQGLIYNYGKIRLTEKGKIIAYKTNAYNYVNKHWRKLSSDVKELIIKDPKLFHNNAYDIQNSAIQIALSLDKILKYSEKRSLKNIAYRYGIPYESLFIIHGLIIRDKYLNKKLYSRKRTYKPQRKKRYTRKKRRPWE